MIYLYIYHIQIICVTIYINYIQIINNELVRIKIHKHSIYKSD